MKFGLRDWFKQRSFSGESVHGQLALTTGEIADETAKRCYERVAQNGTRARPLVPLSDSRSRSIGMRGLAQNCSFPGETMPTERAWMTVQIAGEPVQTWHFLALSEATFVTLSPPGTDSKQGFFGGVAL